MGYAGDLVVGVWVGRDDNSPLGRVSGGTVPARIWRDFMMRALNLKRAAAPPPADPGVVEEPDANDGGLIIGPDGATLQLPGGEVRIDGNGVGIEGTDYEAVRQRIEEARQRTEERLQQARDRIEVEEAADPGN